MEKLQKVVGRFSLLLDKTPEVTINAPNGYLCHFGNGFRVERNGPNYKREDNLFKSQETRTLSGQTDHQRHEHLALSEFE